MLLCTRHNSTIHRVYFNPGSQGPRLPKSQSCTPLAIPPRLLPSSVISPSFLPIFFLSLQHCMLHRSGYQQNHCLSLLSHLPLAPPSPFLHHLNHALAPPIFPSAVKHHLLWSITHPSTQIDQPWEWKFAVGELDHRISVDSCLKTRLVHRHLFTHAVYHFGAATGIALIILINLHRSFLKTLCSRNITRFVSH